MPECHSTSDTDPYRHHMDLLAIFRPTYIIPIVQFIIWFLNYAQLFFCNTWILPNPILTHFERWKITIYIFVYCKSIIIIIIRGPYLNWLDNDILYFLKIWEISSSILYSWYWTHQDYKNIILRTFRLLNQNNFLM